MFVSAIGKEWIFSRLCGFSSFLSGWSPLRGPLPRTIMVLMGRLYMCVSVHFTPEGWQRALFTIVIVPHMCQVSLELLRSVPYTRYHLLSLCPRCVLRMCVCVCVCVYL